MQDGMGVDGQGKGLLAVLVGDGRPLLTVTALGLILSGAFALFLSAMGQFLPHDLQFLGASSAELKALADGRVAAFMFHDRAAFGGALMAVGVLYLWLIYFPMATRQRWAWWTMATSGVTGFGSFLSYLGYGYLDSWHGAATLFLLPLFVWGLAKTRADCVRPALPAPERWSRSARTGRALLLLSGLGMIAGGTTIAVVGMTSVFVPTDLAFMDISAAELEAENPRLVPLIAHDRAGFGGAITTAGLLVMACAWFARPSRDWLEALALAGLAGFGAAIGVHFAVGYTDPGHLLPAVAGAFGYSVGWLLLLLGKDEAGDGTSAQSRRAEA